MRNVNTDLQRRVQQFRDQFVQHRASYGNYLSESFIQRAFASLERLQQQKATDLVQVRTIDQVQDEIDKFKALLNIKQSEQQEQQIRKLIGDFKERIYLQNANGVRPSGNTAFVVMNYAELKGQIRLTRNVSSIPVARRVKLFLQQMCRVYEQQAYIHIIYIVCCTQDDLGEINQPAATGETCTLIDWQQRQKYPNISYPNVYLARDGQPISDILLPLAHQYKANLFLLVNGGFVSNHNYLDSKFYLDRSLGSNYIMLYVRLGPNEEGTRVTDFDIIRALTQNIEPPPPQEVQRQQLRYGECTRQLCQERQLFPFYRFSNSLMVDRFW